MALHRKFPFYTTCIVLERLPVQTIHLYIFLIIKKESYPLSLSQIPINVMSVHDLHVAYVWINVGKATP